jgi:hypothetical protein
MPLRACHTSFMQTSETYMIEWHARIHQQCDFVLLVTCHTKRGNSGTRRSLEHRVRHDRRDPARPQHGLGGQGADGLDPDAGPTAARQRSRAYDAGFYRM